MKILIFDIETAPSKGFIWSLWKEVRNFSFIDRDWYVLCWAAKWLDSKEIMSSSLPEFPDYNKNKENDRDVLLKLHKLLDEADVVIAHNGINFDRKKVNARFIYHGITPPSPYRMIDTLDVCRKEFAFTSNRLNDVGQFLNIGKKLDTGGFQLWKDCLDGDLIAWKKMVRYCKRDISLLEKVYLTLRPYISQHPNIALEADRPSCPKCHSHKINFRGYYYTNASQFKRFKCLSCGGWGKQRGNVLKNKETITSI